MAAAEGRENRSFYGSLWVTLQEGGTPEKADMSWAKALGQASIPSG